MLSCSAESAILLVLPGTQSSEHVFNKTMGYLVDRIAINIRDRALPLFLPSWTAWWFVWPAEFEVLHVVHELSTLGR